jgi:hypothetical protein
VPVQAVITVADQATVYVLEDNESVPRPVEIGLDNNRMVHVISGLEPGELVLLAPPLKSGEMDSGHGGNGSDKTPGGKGSMGQKIRERLNRDGSAPRPKSPGSGAGPKGPRPQAGADTNQARGGQGN